MASALATINVKNHIPFTLELDPPNYTIWRELFLTLVGKFGASSHVDGTPAPDDPDADWLAIDCSVRSLIYSSSSPRVLRLIMENGAFAHTVWTKAANLFLDNKASRAMTLEAKFRALTQGDLPVLEYAQRLKDLADGLADLEQPVGDLQSYRRLFKMMPATLPISKRDLLRRWAPGWNPEQPLTPGACWPNAPND